MTKVVLHMFMKFRHVKRGTEYVLDDIIFSEAACEEGDDLVFEDSEGIHYAEVQSSMGPYSGLYVIYYGVKDAYFWARPAVEFFDGRFEKLC